MKHTKIKVAVFDRDYDYISKLQRYNANHPDQRLEMNFVYDEAQFYSLPAMDLYVISADLVEYISFPAGVKVMVLVAENTIEAVSGRPAICRYQKATEIKRKMIDYFAGSNVNEYRTEGNFKQCQTVFFTSACGGVGTTSAALAFAMDRAKAGKKVIYIDLNMFSHISDVLPGEGTMSDAIYAVKSKKNAVIRLEAALMKDVSGVMYFGEAKNPMDMLYLTKDDVNDMLLKCSEIADTEYLVVDYTEGFNVIFKAIAGAADAIYLVSDGGEKANGKAEKLLRLITQSSVLENETYIDRLRFVYNAFGSRDGRRINWDGIGTEHIMYRIKDATDREVINNLKWKR